MKNAKMNTTKGMCMGDTALVLNIPAGIPVRAIIEVLDTTNNK